MLDVGYVWVVFVFFPWLFASVEGLALVDSVSVFLRLFFKSYDTPRKDDRKLFQEVSVLSGFAS